MSFHDFVVYTRTKESNNQPTTDFMFTVYKPCFYTCGQNTPESSSPRETS